MDVGWAGVTWVGEGWADGTWGAALGVGLGLARDGAAALLAAEWRIAVRSGGLSLGWWVGGLVLSLAAAACEEATCKCGGGTTCPEGLEYRESDGRCVSADGGLQTATEAGVDASVADVKIDGSWLSRDAAGDALDDDAARVDASGPLPSSDVRLLPSDLSSNVGASELGLSVYRFAPGRDPSAVVRELAAGLSLVAWPSGQRVAAAVTSMPEAPVYETQVVLRPDAPLAEGWYALRLDLPASLGRVVSTHDLDGVPVSRFRVGSKPAVLHIELCGKADGKTKIITTVSEAVRATGALESTVTVTAGATAVACAAVEALPTELTSLCTTPSSSARVGVRLQGLVGTTGVPLTAEGGAAPSFEFEPGSLPEVNGCRRFVPNRVMLE